MTPPASARRSARQARSAARDRIVAATRDLLRTRSYAELTVEEVMRTAQMGRTIFYRHFDDLADVLEQSSREAIQRLYEAQRGLALDPGGDDLAAVRRAFVPAAEIYLEHGPLLRGIAEAARAHPDLELSHRALRDRFTALAAEALRTHGSAGVSSLGDFQETAYALNLMDEAYLLDAFGREPRVSVQTAARTLGEIWEALIHRAQ